MLIFSVVKKIHLICSGTFRAMGASQSRHMTLEEAPACWELQEQLSYLSAMCLLGILSVPRILNHVKLAFMWDLGDRETASNLFFLFGRKAAGWCLCADDTFKQEIIQGLLH